MFLLRCLEAGLSIADLDDLTIGLVMDIWTEKANDAAEREDEEKNGTVYMANQSDFDKF